MKRQSATRRRPTRTVRRRTSSSSRCRSCCACRSPGTSASSSTCSPLCSLRTKCAVRPPAPHRGSLSIERTLALMSCLKLGITAGTPMPILVLEEDHSEQQGSARRAKANVQRDDDDEITPRRIVPRSGSRWEPKLAALLEDAVVHDDEKVHY